MLNNIFSTFKVVSKMYNNWNKLKRKLNQQKKTAEFNRRKRRRFDKRTFDDTLKSNDNNDANGDGITNRDDIRTQFSYKDSIYNDYKNDELKVDNLRNKLDKKELYKIMVLKPEDNLNDRDRLKFWNELRLKLRARLPSNFLFKLITPLNTDNKLHDIDGETTNIIALDCEMCGIGNDGKKSILSRVSIVNYNGGVIYDKFVKPGRGEIITDYRTKITGITKDDIDKGIPLTKCLREVYNIMKGKRIIGHDLRHDFNVLKFKDKLVRYNANKLIDKKKKDGKLNGKQIKKVFKSHINGVNRESFIFDTAKCSLLNGDLNRPRSLKFMVELFLGIIIQGNIHDSVKDAIATMALYRAILPELKKHRNDSITEQMDKIEKNNERERYKAKREIEKEKIYQIKKNKYMFETNYAYQSNILNNLHKIKTWGIHDDNNGIKTNGNDNEIQNDGNLKRNPYKYMLFDTNVDDFLQD